MSLEIQQLINNIDQTEATITNSLLNDSLYTIGSDDEYNEYDISDTYQLSSFMKELKSLQLKNYDFEHKIIKILASKINRIDRFDIKFWSNTPHLIVVETYDSSNKYDLRFDAELDILLNKLIELLNQQNKES